MKKNSQKLLLLSFPALRDNLSLTYEQVKVLLPDLTPGGRRSLLFHLEKEGLITKEKVLDRQTISLTSMGERRSTAIFPSLSYKWEQWDGSWELIVFLEAPKSDPQFRYLRNLLLEEGAVAVTRGVYAAPGEFSTKVIDTIEKLYAESVAVFSINQWRFGSQKKIIVEQFGVIDIIEAYSGISSEITELLKKCKNNVRLTDQQKSRFTPIFNRFWQIVVEDAGFARFYFPNTPTATNILAQLQKLLFCLYPPGK